MRLPFIGHRRDGLVHLTGKTFGHVVYLGVIKATSDQQFLLKELPQGRNGKGTVGITVEGVGEAEASRGEVSNKHLIAMNVFLTACMGQRTLAKQVCIKTNVV